jgi:hypothetical protein
MKSKLEIYALAVCFAAVVCLVISTGIAGYAVFEIAAPELTMRSYTYEKYQTNESYFEIKRSRCSEDKAPRPAEDTLTKQRVEAFAIELKGEKREGFQTLIKCLMFIAVSGIALVLHSKIAKRSRAS